MDIKDMSAEQRKEELARLADAVKAAKAETKTAKTRVAEGKDAVKGAKTAEEKLPSRRAWRPWKRLVRPPRRRSPRP